MGGAGSNFTTHVAVRTAPPIARAATDVLTTIFSFLHVGERAIARAVCRRWRPLNTLRNAIPLRYRDFDASTVLLAWAQSHGWRPTPHQYGVLYMRAIRRGDMSVMQYACGLAGVPVVRRLTIRAYSRAAKYGRIEMLKWLSARGYSSQSARVLYAAEVAVLEWFRQNAQMFGAQWSQIHSRQIAMQRSLAAVKWHYAHQFVHMGGIDLVSGAAASGDCEKLAWVLETVYNPPHAYSASLYEDVAAASDNLGALECAKYLYLKGHRPAGTAVCATAAAAGNLDVLKWLPSHGAQWDKVSSLQYARAAQAKLVARLDSRARAGKSVARTGARLANVEAVIDWIRQP
jgi:hypothetical protein